MLRLFPIQTSVFVGGLILGLSMLQSAEAQRRGLGGMRPGNVSPARLLTRDAVQAELRLTEGQKAKAAAINETLTAGRHELFAEVAKDTGKRGPKVAELNRQAQAGIDKLLNDTQRKRFAELLLQANGASELNRKKIREALGITKEQQRKLAEVSRANARARREALADFDGDRVAKMVELQRAADKRLLGVLTEEQRNRFEEMQGEKIELNLFAS